MWWRMKQLRRVQMGIYWWRTLHSLMSSDVILACGCGGQEQRCTDVGCVSMMCAFRVVYLGMGRVRVRELGVVYSQLS